MLSFGEMYENKGHKLQMQIIQRNYIPRCILCKVNKPR